MTSPTVESKIAALLSVLEEDIRHVEAALSRLDSLRTLLVKRDDAALEALLGDISRQAETHTAHEQQRQRLRRELAAELGCNEDDLTLSKLRTELTGQTRAAVTERQTQLKSLTARLKREHALTALLVQDCARFNRSLLRAFFGSAGRGGMTYSPNGVAKHKTDAGLVSLRL